MLVFQLSILTSILSVASDCTDSCAFRITVIWGHIAVRDIRDNLAGGRARGRWSGVGGVQCSIGVVDRLRRGRMAARTRLPRTPLSECFRKCKWWVRDLVL